MTDEQKKALENIHLEIPDIVLGKVVPHGVQNLIDEEERKAEMQQEEAKKSRRSFWAGVLVNVVCSIGGAILGFLLGKFY